MPNHRCCRLLIQLFQIGATPPTFAPSLGSAARVKVISQGFTGAASPAGALVTEVSVVSSGGYCSVEAV